jgi:hypothetical protein
MGAFIVMNTSTSTFPLKTLWYVLYDMAGKVTRSMNERTRPVGSL